MLRPAAWLALLFAGYGIQRGLCAAGLPYDCDSADVADVFNGLTMLAFVGGGLGWLAGVTHPARFAWLAAPRRAYLWAAYAALFPAYSALSNVPALQASLASTSVSPAFVAVNAAGEGPGRGWPAGSPGGTRGAPLLLTPIFLSSWLQSARWRLLRCYSTSGWPCSRRAAACMGAAAGVWRRLKPQAQPPRQARLGGRRTGRLAQA